MAGHVLAAGNLLNVCAGPQEAEETERVSREDKNRRDLRKISAFKKTEAFVGGILSNTCMKLSGSGGKALPQTDRTGRHTALLCLGLTSTSQLTSRNAGSDQECDQCKMVQSLEKIVFPQNVTIGLTNSTPRYRHTRETKTYIHIKTCAWKFTRTFFHSSQRVERTQLFINW